MGEMMPGEKPMIWIKEQDTKTGHYPYPFSFFCHSEETVVVVVLSSCGMLGFFLSILGGSTENTNSLSSGRSPMELHTFLTRRFSRIHLSISFMCLLLLKLEFSNWRISPLPPPMFPIIWQSSGWHYDKIKQTGREKLLPAATMTIERLLAAVGCFS